MDERASKVFAGLSVLVVLWIGVYWLWEPSTPRVSFGGEPLVEPAPASQAEPGASVSTEIQPDPGESIWMGVPAAKPAVTAPGFSAYTLREGDTFETIAAERWGDPSLWTAVARANPLKDPRRLKDGQVIRLPDDVGNIQGVALDPQGPGGGIAEQSSERTHTVESGDTLSSIALRYLGSSTEARRVFELNRDRLADMHSLKIGQKLRLPAPGSGG